VIPLIAKTYPQAKQNLLDNINRFREIKDLYDLGVNEFRKKLLKKKGSEVHIPVKSLMGFENRAMIYEIISEFGFSDKHIDELIKLAESENGKYIQSLVTGTRIIKFNHWFIVSAQPSSFSETFIVEEGVKNVQCSMFHVQCSILESSNFKPQTSNLKLQTSNSTASLDAGLISYPLIIRKWKQGDYFYPLGMKKKMPG